MKTQIKMLKVKIKSLAEEARIIRLEEKRAGGRRLAKKRWRDMGRGFFEPDPQFLVFRGRDDVLRESLHRHRIDVVRAEQRLSLLAYAFLRGRPLAKVEPKAETPPDWGRVAKLVEKFGAFHGSEGKAAQAGEFAAWRAMVTA